MKSEVLRSLRSSPHTAEALTSKIGTLSLEAQAKLDKEAAKKEAKADAKADAALKKKLASQVCTTLSSTAIVLTFISCR